jgi:hypothetical protein
MRRHPSWRDPCEGLLMASLFLSSKYCYHSFHSLVEA